MEKRTCSCGQEETRKSTGTGTCTRCSEYVTGTLIPINPNTHDWGNWTQTTLPTFVVDGIKTRACIHNPSHIDSETQIGDSANNKSIEGITTYLTAAEAPVNLPVNIHLGTMTQAESNWQKLLTVIAAANKNVKLDLSACTIIGTEFTPYGTITTGTNKIIEIIVYTTG